MNPSLDHPQRFASYLAGLAAREDRAALAALRRGLGKAPGEAAEMHPYIMPWLPSEARPRQEEALYLVAALFAWHQGTWTGNDDDPYATNFGASFRRLASVAGGESVERRFVGLLNCHEDDLPEHLRRAVGLMRSRDIPIDWAQLLRDLPGWGHESRYVQRRWARAYWGDISQSNTLETTVQPLDA